MRITLKEYQKLNLLLISIIGKKQIFHHTQKTKFEQNNKTVAINVLFVPHNTEERRLAHKSKHSFQLENQVTLLIITDGKKKGVILLKKEE